MKTSYFTGIIIILFLIAAIRPRHAIDNVITVRFKHWVGNKELQLFDETYTNAFGEPFVINKFRYYISHISFTDIKGKTTRLPDNYYLVNEADSVSKSIQLPNTSAIQSISFIIGVDSIKNISGVQTGSLDPVNGMFWTWKSGYIFAKLEGQSDVSPAPAHSFTWDIGGFRQHENALREVELILPAGPVPANHTIIVDVNILKWFDGMHPLKIAQSPVCHQPGGLAMQIADNYSTMFSVAQ